MDASDAQLMQPLEEVGGNGDFRGTVGRRHDGIEAGGWKRAMPEGPEGERDSL